MYFINNNEKITEHVSIDYKNSWKKLETRKAKTSVN